MESKLFKISALTAVILGVVALPAKAATDSATSLEYVEKVNDFLDGSTLNGLVVVDTRSRTRSTGKPNGKDGDVWSRLNYSAYNVVLDFTSGYHDGWLGADIAGYLSGDLYNDSYVNSKTGEYITNEISTSNNLDWGSGEGKSIKITKAALKFKAGDHVDGRFGFTQANGNGVLGNVWSFVPGTYRGAELNANLGNFKATYFIADQYTAPWLLSEKDYAPALWSDTTWGIAHSLGLQGNATDDLFLQLGIGQVTDVRYVDTVDWDAGSVSKYKGKVNTTGYKVYAKYNINDSMSIAYDFYGVNDDAQYDGLGYTTGLAFNANMGQFSWMTNLNYAKSENDRDVNPRMIYTYAMTNGTHSQWWDALSDWNKSGENSIYNRLSFDQGNGWNYYLGFGYGSGSKSAANGATGDWDYKSEYAVNGTVSYSVLSGALKGSTLLLHGTVLERNEYSGAPSADETDLCFQVIIPYTF